MPSLKYHRSIIVWAITFIQLHQTVRQYILACLRPCSGSMKNQQLEWREEIQLKSAICDLDTNAVSDNPTFAAIICFCSLLKGSASITTPAGFPPVLPMLKEFITCTSTFIFDELFLLIYLRQTHRIVCSGNGLTSNG